MRFGIITAAIFVSTTPALAADTRMFTVPDAVARPTFESANQTNLHTVVAVTSRSTRSCDVFVRWRSAPADGSTPPASVATPTVTLAPGRRVVFTTYSPGFSGWVRPPRVPADAIRPPTDISFETGWAEVYSPNCTSSTGLNAAARLTGVVYETVNGPAEAVILPIETTVPVIRGP